MKDEEESASAVPSNWLLFFLEMKQEWDGVL